VTLYWLLDVQERHTALGCT